MCFALWAIIGGGFSRMGYGRRMAIIGAAAAVLRIVGFAVEAGSENNAWLNVMQYIIPVSGAAWALAGIFRQKVSRHIDIRKQGLASVIGHAGAV